VRRATSTCTNTAIRADEVMQMLDLGMVGKSWLQDPFVPPTTGGGQRFADGLRARAQPRSIWSDWWGLQGRSEGRDLRETARLLQEGRVQGRDALRCAKRDPEHKSGSGQGDCITAAERGSPSRAISGRVRGFTANPAWALGLDFDRRHARAREDGGCGALVGPIRCGCTPAPLRSTTTGWLVYDRNDPAHQAQD